MARCFNQIKVVHRQLRPMDDFIDEKPDTLIRNILSFCDQKN